MVIISKQLEILGRERETIEVKILELKRTKLIDRLNSRLDTEEER